MLQLFEKKNILELKYFEETQKNDYISTIKNPESLKTYEICCIKTKHLKLLHVIREVM